LFKKLNKNKVTVYFENKKRDDNKLYYEILLLAYLDSVGFAKRAETSLEKLFPRVLIDILQLLSIFKRQGKN
jgi:hypothetical protein